MKSPHLTVVKALLAAQILVNSAYGLIIKVRHYDLLRSRTYDLNLCRPLQGNKIIILQEKCDGVYSMPGWRLHYYDSDWTPPRTVVDLFGPPFGPITQGMYEEPRPYAAWGGSLFYGQDPWKPMMFRTSYDREEGYEWRLSFEPQRNGMPFPVTPATPLAVGDVLEPIDDGQDYSMTMTDFPSLVSCNSPSGRVLRRTQNFNRPNARIILDYERIKRYGSADCLTVKLVVSSLGYTDPAYPIMPPADPYPLDQMSGEVGSSDTDSTNLSSEALDASWSSSAFGTSSVGSFDEEISSQDFDDDDDDDDEILDDDPEWQAIERELEEEWQKAERNGEPLPLQNINMDDFEIDRVIQQYLTSPEAKNFDEGVLRQQLEDVGSLDDLDLEIARLEELLAAEEAGSERYG